MRKRKSSLDVPVQVYNLGSIAGTQMDFGRDELWKRMDTEMGREAVSIPVFLVNKEQMDMLRPPKYKRALDPECVRRLIQEMWELIHETVSERYRESQSEEEEVKDKIDFFFEHLRRCEEEGWAKYEKTVAVGLYLNLERYDVSFRDSVLNLGDNSVLTPQADEIFLNYNEPAIFLCCERIVDRADKLGISHHLVMDKVYYHELGHAIMDTLPKGAPDPYNETWGRIIEESLANAIAYRCFKGKEARWVERLIETQPAEYLGYAAANKVPVNADEIIERWINRYFHRLIDFHDFWYIWWRTWKDWIKDLTDWLLPWPILPEYEPEYEIASLLLQERIDLLNITFWKRFKKKIAHSGNMSEIWKKFAIYLLYNGLRLT